MKLIVITGLSGSGKSTALRAFEDMGFFCVDNLPIRLFPKFLELSSENSEVNKIATVMDVREKEFLISYERVFEEIHAQGYKIEILFLEASDEVLIRRFKETRRRHPLAKDGAILEGIAKERACLSDIKKMATKVVDTSFFSIHDLRQWVKSNYSSTLTSEQLSINLISFGFKYGLPYEADIIMDVRFLPNPYFVPGLKGLDGRDERVVNYIKKWKETGVFLEKFLDLIYYLLPLYCREGKTYLNIGIGCTGGRHRSVVIANILKEYLSKKMNYRISVNYRDIEAG